MVALAVVATACAGSSAPSSGGSPPPPSAASTHPTCLPSSPPEGTLSVTGRRAARRRLAPGSPEAVTVCRYAGLPSLRLVRSEDVPRDGVPALVAQLNALRLVPFRKAFLSCPADRGDIDLVLLRYGPSNTIPIKVSLSGCRYAMNRFGQPFATTVRFRAAVRRLVGGPPG